MGSLLVKGKYVLTMDEKYGIIQDGAVIVENDKIIDVGSSKEIERSYSADEIIDAKDCVVMPGLINSHNHMYGILSHGIPVSAAPSTFIGFLEEFWWPHVENLLDKDQIYSAALMSSAEMIRTGTTCSADILEAPNAIPGALDVEAKATEEIGIRSILSFEATERMSEENGWKGLEENLEFIKRRNTEENTLTRGMFCVHTTFTCSMDFLKRARDFANRHPAGMHIHLEEGSYESEYCRAKYGKLPVELYEEIGFLNKDLLASQCVHTTSREIDILRRHDVKIAHMPLSNCEVGGGIAPIPDFIERGSTVGLGTDGYIQNMFEVMRSAFLVHKGYRQDASIMDATTVIRMATIEGAKALGIEKSVGSISPGKRADLITVDLKASTPVTPRNLITHLVVFGDGSMVQDVLVNGREIMSDRRVLTIDENLARERCINAAGDLWESH